MRGEIFDMRHRARYLLRASAAAARRSKRADDIQRS